MYLNNITLQSQKSYRESTVRDVIIYRWGKREGNGIDHNVGHSSKTALIETLKDFSQ